MEEGGVVRRQFPATNRWQRPEPIAGREGKIS
jgi:hypothetical protein